MKVKDKEIVRVTESLGVGWQPSVEDIDHLAEEGFLTVINLRNNDEESMELRPDEEGEIVRGNGLRYSHIPVWEEDMHAEEVDMFRHDLKELMGPAYVHCSDGRRAAAFTMMHYAVETGVSPEAVLQKAGELGLDVGSDKTRQFMKEYISSRHEEGEVDMEVRRDVREDVEPKNERDIKRNQAEKPDEWAAPEPED